MFIINSFIQKKNSSLSGWSKRQLGVAVGPFNNEEDAEAAIALLEEKYKDIEDIMEFTITRLCQIDGLC